MITTEKPIRPCPICSKAAPADTRGFVCESCWGTGERLSEKARDVAMARLRLSEWCPPGTTVYTLLTHVSASGMTRWIKCFIMQDNVPMNISWHVGKLLGWSTNGSHEGVKVEGCGMDMGFHLVHNLSYALHGTESRGAGIEAERRHQPFPQRDTNPENYRAGYSLEPRWL